MKSSKLSLDFSDNPSIVTNLRLLAAQQNTSVKKLAEEAFENLFTIAQNSKVKSRDQLLQGAMSGTIKFLVSDEELIYNNTADSWESLKDCDE